MLADTIAGLAANPDRCREMGERARRAFVAEFDMPMAMEQWENLLDEMSGLRRSGAHNNGAMFRFNGLAERSRRPTNERKPVLASDKQWAKVEPHIPMNRPVRSHTTDV
jgi:hypothetical protein